MFDPADQHPLILRELIKNSPFSDLFRSVGERKGEQIKIGNLPGLPIHLETLKRDDPEEAEKVEPLLDKTVGEAFNFMFTYDLPRIAYPPISEVLTYLPPQIVFIPGAGGPLARTSGLFSDTSWYLEWVAYPKLPNANRISWEVFGDLVSKLFPYSELKGWYDRCAEVEIIPPLPFHLRPEMLDYVKICQGAALGSAQEGWE